VQNKDGELDFHQAQVLEDGGINVPVNISLGVGPFYLTINVDSQAYFRIEEEYSLNMEANHPWRK
jgi:hypothetical protein